MHRRAKPGLPGAMIVVVWLGLAGVQAVAAQEYRALWVDAWGYGIKNSNEVSQLVSDARSGHFNAIVVQVRRRGDAMYNGSPYEPKAVDSSISPPEFDPLGDLIQKAHDEGSGPRLEVHAWIVAYPVWNKTDAPPQSDHPLNLHPDWVSRSNNGLTWDGSNYNFDPSHPEVQRHIFNVALDIVTRYDVDGLNWDYIRYPGSSWGYNPVAVERFNRLRGRTGQPSATDPVWLQFRRDQVSALVRKVYLSVLAVKPWVKLSADTFMGAPGVTTDAGWTNSSRAYTSVLQDWRSWMEEGILDLNLPMAYFAQDGSYLSDWQAWNLFAKRHRFNRQLVIGPALYLNGISNSLVQIRHALAPTPTGERADGVCGYSYRVTSDDSEPRAVFLQALTQTSSYDPVTPPIFGQTAAVPSMPWKSNPTRGHLKGQVFVDGSGLVVDGARLVLTGAVTRVLNSDATGFYGAVDLEPGVYGLEGSGPGTGYASATVTIGAGEVTTLDLVLPNTDATAPQLSEVTVRVNDRLARISWSTDEHADGSIEYGLDAGYGLRLSETSRSTLHVLTVTNLASATLYHFRVSSRDSFGNQAVSADGTFTTNPEGVVSEVIIDNRAARAVGSWTVSAYSSDRYGEDYCYKAQGSGAAYVQFTPDILDPGYYDVFAWYPEGGNRPVDAPHTVLFLGGSNVVTLDQTTGGGRWNGLGRYLFAVGTGGWVRVTDSFADAGKVVMADAVKLTYAAPPPSPPVIVTQPTSLTVLAGHEAVIRVVAGSSAPLFYQWRRNGVTLAGETNSALCRASAQLADAGQYAVEVGNVVGRVTSRSVSLVVLQEPIEFLALTRLAGDRVRLSLRADPASAYVLEGSEDGVAWFWLANFSAPAGRFDYVDGPVSGRARRYYRARSAQ